MKTLLVGLVFLSLVVSPCLAEETKKDSMQAAPTRMRTGIVVMGGYLYVKGTVPQAGSSDLGGIGGPAYNFEFAVEAKPQFQINPGFSGFKTTSTFSDGRGNSGSLDTKNTSVYVLLRFYTLPAGRPRLFVEAGPSVNFLKVTYQKAGAVVINGPLAGTNKTNKPGGILNGGGQVPVSKSAFFQIVTGYAFVPKWNGADASTFRFEGGIGFWF